MIRAGFASLGAARRRGCAIFVMDAYIKDLSTKSLRFVRENCRNLEAARIRHLFLGESADNVVTELRRFANNDGGFGRGLEPDFALPASSPMATSVGFQILEETAAPSDHPVVREAIRYLRRTFEPELRGWPPVPRQVNDHPHAPWWHFSLPDPGSSADANWGNPTAELAGYLVGFGEPNGGSDRIESAASDEAIKRLLSAGDSMEPHELYCYLRLYDCLPDHRRTQLESKLTALVEEAVCLDASKWGSYTPQPIDFVRDHDSFLFTKYQKALAENISYLLDTVSEDGVWYPTWSWGDGYPEAWERARIEWIGIIAVKHLRAISEFGGHED
jgi:hypothetical protein